MTDSANRDKLDAIIGYLQQNSVALSTLDRRMEALSTDVKVACETMRSVAERQALLEQSTGNSLANCSDVMDSMKQRILALEKVLTPIPEPFDPTSFDERPCCRDNACRNGNGADTQKFLLAIEDDEAKGDEE